MKYDYYAVDGYHGGKYGHMPLGSVCDILQKMKAEPQWKLSLDIEPVSWDELKLRDPASYAELRKMLMDTSIGARLEIVASTYSQPYAWLTDGESFIRQMRYGLKKTAEHFPFLKVTTYAVQEPCWTSALPQILRSFGFELAVLKNPSTAWAGYCQGAEGESRIWIGPDGTEIPVIPRYACEGLLTTWHTESNFPRQGFVNRCRNEGIEHPAGMCYQDLGWRAHAYVDHPFFVDYLPHEILPEERVVYTTWKEYSRFIAAQKAKPWYVTQEDFRVTLPWGDQQLTHMARMVRRGENRLLEAQWMDALTYLHTGKKAGRIMDLAAEQVMLAQHHDAWICASCGEQEKNWAYMTTARILSAEHLISEMRNDAVNALDEMVKISPAIGEKEIMNVNFLAREEERYASVPMTFAPHVRGVRVYQDGKEIPHQFVCERFYEDGSWNAGTLLARIHVQGMGANNIRVEMSEEELHQKAIASACIIGDAVEMENDLYHLKLDLRRGGAITSLIHKKEGRNIVDEADARPFNGFTGYSIRDNKWISSADTPAKAEIIMNGSLVACVRIEGRVDRIPFSQTITMKAGEKAIAVEAEFDFPAQTRIGDPFIVDDHEATTQRHRSHHDGRYKLNAYFPTRFARKKIYKDAAFDVCESRNADTHFQGWDEIKHNILISFVDVCDQEQGLAVYSDHTTAYTHGEDEPLGLTLAWAGDGGYWWRNRELCGKHSVCYELLPHFGDWQDADLWHEGQKMRHPVFSRQLGGVSSESQMEMICVSNGNAQLSDTMIEDDGSIVLRLFNPGKEMDQELILSERFASEAELCEMDGRTIACLKSQPDEKGGQRLMLPMPAFAVRSLRLKKRNEGEKR